MTCEFVVCATIWTSFLLLFCLFLSFTFFDLWITRIFQFYSCSIPKGISIFSNLCLCNNSRSCNQIWFWKDCFSSSIMSVSFVLSAFLCTRLPLFKLMRMNLLVTEKRFLDPNILLYHMLLQSVKHHNALHTCISINIKIEVGVSSIIMIDEIMNINTYHFRSTNGESISGSFSFGIILLTKFEMKTHIAWKVCQETSVKLLKLHLNFHII